MSSLQIRNVPEDVLRTLKARASAAGQSLSEYALGELAATTARPTLDELNERIRLRGHVDPDTSAAETLHAERTEHAA
ncbi:MAG TPA: hypothetical protein VFQ96_03455 [Microbacteriaceae bacterium]|nr:hypothetical protein [Microbacteriaceae bacterium]